MIPKPIGPTAHVANDYVLAAVLYAAPGLFGLHGVARGLCYVFGATYTVINGLTDNPLGLMRLIPFRVHGDLETPFVPAMLVLPLITGAMRRKAARRFFLSFFLVAAAHYVLSDYNADERRRRRVAAPPRRRGACGLEGAARTPR